MQNLNSLLVNVEYKIKMKELFPELSYNASLGKLIEFYEENHK